MGSLTLPRLPNSMLSKAKASIAMRCCMAGASLARAEGSCLLNAPLLCRPSAPLPPCKGLAGPLLGKRLDEAKSKAEKRMTPSPRLSIACGGWPSAKSEPIVNYMAASPSATLLLKPASAGEAAYDAQLVADDVDRAMKRASTAAARAVGAAAGKASASKAAWAPLKQSCPGRLLQGCASHGLHLLAKGALNAAKARRGREPAAYPGGCPLQGLLELAAERRGLARLLHNAMPKSPARSRRSGEGG